MPALKPEIAIMKVLSDDAGISAAADGGIWAGYAPQSTDVDEYFVIVRRASTTVDYKMTGPSALKECETDIWITGPSYETLTDLAELIEDEMHTAVHRQTITISADSITFSKAFLTDQADEQEVIDDGTGKPTRRIAQRWRLAYQNT